MASPRKELPSTDPIEQAIAYHDRTKHHFGQYARSIGYMDWETQPNPFRRYDGATRIVLAHPPLAEHPTYDSLLSGYWEPCSSINQLTISQFFYESLAISAWKRIGTGEPWSLRINPSSGDLHPTEGYLVAGPIADICDKPAVYHYNVYEHALERRVILADEHWASLAAQLPSDGFLVALASVYWRESWKYGERAFRYCHHDVGHAIGAITFSAAVLGWHCRLAIGVPDDQLNVLIGVATQHGIEAEHGDCIIVVAPATAAMEHSPILKLPAALLASLRAMNWEGRPNALSSEHHLWPVIDKASAVCRHEGDRSEADRCVALNNVARPELPDRLVPARAIIRQRRSAVDMDGATNITREVFYRMLMDVVPAFAPFPFDVLPWCPRVSLALFVHRVEELSPGVYLLVRDASHEVLLRQRLRAEFLWERAPDCPPGLDLYLLVRGDARQAAKAISCHQEIAADGAFSMGMLAQFASTLEQRGAWMYPRLFWETGLIGQVLYLGSEVANVRATGIGCFFDDPVHELFGFHGMAYQSLYHFTIGGHVEDTRLTTLPPYPVVSLRRCI